MNPISLFRVLIPSWQFFSDSQEVPFLKHRSGAGPETLSEWRETLTPTPRKLSNLFLNAKGNADTAAFSLLSQLAEDPSNAVFLEQASRLVKSRLDPTEPYFQWKLCVDLPTEDGRYVEQDLLTSGLERQTT